MNIIDAEALHAGGLLPAAMAALPGAGDINHHCVLAYMLSPLPAVAGAPGALHQDPAMGSGWQWVAAGQKEWFVVDCAGSREFSRNACRAMPCPPDMAAVAAGARVLRATLQAGDFLAFPVNHVLKRAAVRPPSCGPRRARRRLFDDSSAGAETFVRPEPLLDRR